ncbi:MAG: AAA family ATPase [Burkholderiaceae bacterium]|nr:AAA family ATPase [Burkholderiaceae bacterium]
MRNQLGAMELHDRNFAHHLPAYRQLNRAKLSFQHQSFRSIMAPASTQQTSNDLPDIKFPVVQRFAVSGYEIYEQKDPGGFDHSFLPGPTIVAGINGLGKTTLLNILFRMLVGPLNPAKSNPFEIGAKSHELVPWNTPKYFRARVTDDAQKATAYVEIKFGTFEIKVRRRLTDLSISELWINDRESPPSESEFQRAVIEGANVGSSYDYDFLVRYLVFFLEQRVELFWNERGQIEAFRILLCKEPLALRMSELRDTIQQLDSKYRNLRWHSNRRKNQLAELETRAASADADSARIAALQSEAQSFKMRGDELASKIVILGDEKSETRSTLLIRKIELEQLQREYQALEQDVLSKMFPSGDETAKYLFSTLLSASGCIACGNESSRGETRMRRLLASRCCPVCESPPEEQERIVPATETTPQQLEILDQKVKECTRAIVAMVDKETNISKALQSFLKEHSEAAANYEIRAAALRKLGSRPIATSSEMDSLRNQVGVDSTELKSLYAELQTESTAYAALVSDVQAKFSAISEKVSNRFSHYCKSLLREKCTLGVSTYRDNVGQEYSYVHSCFDVYMTSATSPDVPTVRHSRDDVSESQREFIDLAFRMALIDATASPGTAAMLVIETPEASLDGFFIDEAGTMLRSFGQDTGRPGNVAIVTSNLSKQNLIGAALGFIGEDVNWPTSDEVHKRLINLLHISKENGALRESRQLYEKILLDAVHGRI